MASLYESIIFEKDISSRLEVYIKNKSKIDNVINVSKHSFLRRFKVKFGIYIAIILKKGFKLLVA